MPPRKDQKLTADQAGILCIFVLRYSIQNRSHFSATIAIAESYKIAKISG
jgi:hypothetical protein